MSIYGEYSIAYEIKRGFAIDAEIKPTKTVPLRARRLEREAWILAARDALIDKGIESVKIERLAKNLEAQRGSFYHHFKSRDALLEELLDHWNAHKLAPIRKPLIRTRIMVLQNSPASLKCG